MSNRRTGSSETPAALGSTCPSWASRIAGETSEGLNADDESCTVPISFELTRAATTAHGILRRAPASGPIVTVPASTLLLVARASRAATWSSLTWPGASVSFLGSTSSASAGSCESAET